MTGDSRATTCILLAAAMVLPSCRIINGQVDYSWVGEQFSPPVEDSVYIDRGTGALDIPASTPLRQAGTAAATPQPAALPAPLPKTPPQQEKDGFFTRLFGQKAEAPAAPTEAQRYISYTVVAGDTLSGIARRHGTTARRLIDINQLDTTRPLQINQKLRIPAAAAPTHHAAAAPTSSRQAPTRQKKGFFSRIFGQDTTASPTGGKVYYTTYTVVAGDTLSGIARRHGTTARRLIDINQLDTTRPLQINQKLRIPTHQPPAPARQQRVLPPPAAPAQAEIAPPVSEPIGQLPPVSPTIPGAVKALPPTPPTAPVTPAPTTHYTVQPGDTIFGIARKLNITPDALMKSNGLTPETAGQIRAGASLNLPTSSPSTTPPQP